jgi:hypothetical protein
MTKVLVYQWTLYKGMGFKVSFAAMGTASVESLHATPACSNVEPVQAAEESAVAEPNAAVNGAPAA